MSSEWIRTTIGDQIQLQRGIDITKRDFRDGTIPVVSSGGVGGFHDTPTGTAPGVILGRKGVVGSVYYLPTDYWAHDTTLWVKDFKGNHPRYVYYFFKSIAGTLRDLDVGSANPTLNRNHVHPIETSWASFAHQKAIAHILGTLDDNIELNRKTNETLEAMARTLFKSWFVDFDPVRAKSEGRPTELPDEISDLFPDSFEDSELGEIPRGWRISSLDEIADNRRETVRPGDIDSSDRYIGLEHMPRGSICLGESGDAADLESSKSRFSEGDVLYGKLRPYFKKTGYAQFDGVCSTDIVVARKKSKNGTGFICCLLASDSFIDFTVSASTGTRMPRTNWKDMCEFSFAIPTPLLLKEFDNQFCRLIERIKTSCSHSRHLAST
jgi:type I restriction enzyme S subunit